MSKGLKIGIGVAIGVAILLALNIIKKDIHVERTKTVNASLETIQNQITNFEHFSTWSPWADIDPNSKETYKGEQGQVGAEFHWESESEDVGTGYMKTTSISNERVDMDLVFTAPWESESKVYYTFEEKGESVDVTWGYDGEMPIMATFFVNMDEMLGGQYEKGLAALKEKLEK